MGRFLDTSLIQLDVQPRLVRLLIKVHLGPHLPWTLPPVAAHHHKA